MQPQVGGCEEGGNGAFRKNFEDGGVTAGVQLSVAHNMLVS
jgi:hypothetical protein